MKITTYVVDNDDKCNVISSICEKNNEKRIGIYLRNKDKYNGIKYVFPELSVESNIIYYKKLYSDLNYETEKYLDAFRLKKIRKTKSKKINFKNQEKLGLAITFIGMPEVIILDNPFESLGTETSESIKKLILEYSTDNKAEIIILSNNSIEYEDISDSILCINNNEVEVIKGEVL